MTDRGEPGARAVPPELCDLGGEAISGQAEVHALVPDSSVIHGHDPKLDGKRWLTACSREHSDALIGRAIEAHRGRIDPEELAKETGLTQEQIEPGESWQGQDALRRHRRFEKADGPESSG
ncbi:hypothetical protein GCM10010260_78420 [Streptomyces filipinensis]|uniref:Uncharacterized protein n=1 Tax=Streptomyces filipinensis TaxID=66887 RepID=A0A918IJU3_9ACTN|nr:hypothetical protein [Streptomyces filipinensis]GGV26397.1 hypothetical protein GCM10010260_78420 [Streptomyces filipinensis]